jgi:predicted metalloprotease
VKRTALSSIAVGLVSCLAVACAEPARDDVLTIGSGEGPTAPVASDDPSEVALRAVDDVTAYWQQTYPELYGGEFAELAGFFPYGPDTQPPPCGEPPPTYNDVAENAFYCPIDDIIAWDDAVLMPALNQEFGAFTVAIVIAHEFGHAVQARFGTGDRTVDLELQADCFAGAWTAHVAGGGSDRFSADTIDLDKTVAGLIAIRDLPGTNPDDPAAHGSGFDRVAAFQDGYENTAQTCVEYANESENRRTVEIRFRPGEDFSSGGNFPLFDEEAQAAGVGDEGLFTLVERDLNEFYSRMFTELGDEFTPVGDLVVVGRDASEVQCGGETQGVDDLTYAALYCQDENIVVLDGETLVPALNEDIGDFAVASEVAQLWAIAAQSQLGVADADNAGLQADCLTGAWSAWTFPAEDGTAESEILAMSAGDLDEGIMAFLAYGTGDDGQPTVFERTEALRTGFFDDYDACEEYGSLG